MPAARSVSSCSRLFVYSLSKAYIRGGTADSARSFTTSSSSSTPARLQLSSRSASAVAQSQSSILSSSSRSLFSTYSTPNAPAELYQAPHLKVTPTSRPAKEASPIDAPSPTSSEEQTAWSTTKEEDLLRSSSQETLVEDASVPAPASDADAEWAISYLSRLFPSLPSAFPPHVAERIMTHQSYRAGASTYGHNARLSFLGRQVLKAYLLMHLQATVPAVVLQGPGAGGSSVALGAPPAMRDQEGGANGNGGMMTMDGWMDFDAVVDRVLGPKELGRMIAPVWELETNARWTSPVRSAFLSGCHSCNEG